MVSPSPREFPAGTPPRFRGKKLAKSFYINGKPPELELQPCIGTLATYLPLDRGIA